MNEIPQILEPKEKVVYNNAPEYKPYMVGSVFTSIIISLVIGLFIGLYFKLILVALIVGVIVIILGIIISNMAYSRTYYAITNKRVIIQSGIIGRDFKSIDFDRMQNVSVNVGLLGVIFKVGTIRIFTGELESTGGKNPQMKPKYDTFDYIQSPYEVLKELQTHLSKRKEELA